MTSMRALTMAVLLLTAGLVNAAGKPCSAPEHRQFDFWIGEWDVTTADGKPAGKNRIEAILDGCALAEHWRGASGGAGHSYNVYDAKRGVWHQTWVDRQGGLLLLEGGLKDGKMVLSGDQGKTRIIWTPRPDGTVTQLWEATEDQGRTWKTIFHGIYTRQKP